MNAGTLGLGTAAALSALALEGKTVFVRADLNVKMVNGEIEDDTRIVKTIPTVEHILDQGGSVILASHLGRPGGRRDPKFSLEPVAYALSDRLGGKPVAFADDCVGEEVQTAANKLGPGGVLLLENLRFHPEETDNNEAFAAELAALADVFVNDAFDTSRCSHASTVGMAKFFREKAAGLLLTREIEVLTEILKNPARPFVSVLGGSKVSDKLEVIMKLLEVSDRLLIGGMMSFPFLKVTGKKLGGSEYEESMMNAAYEIMVEAEKRGIDVRLPMDHMVAPSMEQRDEKHWIKEASIPGSMVGLDIGFTTVQEYIKMIRGNFNVIGAGTVFWNGTMGFTDDKAEKYKQGTKSIAYAIAGHNGFSVVGGGDSIAVVNDENLTEHFDHVSTGDGAMLHFIAGKKLPGVEALK